MASSVASANESAVTRLCSISDSICRHFGLRENPFGVTPDPRYLYHSGTHQEALNALVTGIECGIGFQALVAMPGMGKTTLLFRLIDRFHAVASTAFLFQTQCDSTQFMQYLLTELGSPARGLGPVEMHDKINSILLRESQAGRRVIVIIDEAQNLQSPVLETVRLLSDFETKCDKLMQIILAGHLPFMQKLDRPELAQLRQRISTIARLQPLGPEETRQYIRNRLRVAGHASGEPFTSDALYALWEYSHGVPRIINTICLNSLVLAHSLKQRSIDRLIVRDVASRLQLHPVQQQSSRVIAAPDAGPFGPKHVKDDEVGSAFRLLIERVQAVTGAAGVALGVLEGKYLVWRAASGSTPSMGDRVSADSGLTGECIRTRQIVRCDDPPRTSRIDQNVCLDRSIRSVVAIPLCERETPVGMIEIFSTKKNGLDHLHQLKLQAMLESMVLPRAATRAQQHAEPILLWPNGTPPSDACIDEGVSAPLQQGAESEHPGEQSDAEHVPSVVAEFAPQAQDPEMLPAVAGYSRRITPSHFPESSAEDHDSLTAPWAAAVRMEESALAAHPSPSRREEESATLPAAAEAQAVETNADARSSEVKSWREVPSDSQAVSPFVQLWRAGRGEFYLAIVLVLVAIVIPWVIWSK